MFDDFFKGKSVLFTALFQAHPIKFANESGQYLRCQGGQGAKDCWKTMKNFSKGDQVGRLISRIVLDYQLFELFSQYVTIPIL